MDILTITKDNFEEVVLKSDKKVLLDFWATWCGPCRMQSPIIDAIAAKRDDIIVGKVNIDEEMELAFTYQVMSIPTLLVFDKGEVSGKTIGLTGPDEIEAML